MARVARAGYRDVPTRENSMFNLLTSFTTTFLVVRTVTYALRTRRTVGPFRNMRVGHRHIHHYVPGIVIALASGAAGIVTRDERLEPILAVPFGVGMGLTLDESALLLEFEDVYWTRRGPPERADHAHGRGDAWRARARVAVPEAGRGARPRAGRLVYRS